MPVPCTSSGKDPPREGRRGGGGGEEDRPFLLLLGVGGVLMVDRLDSFPAGFHVSATGHLVTWCS